MDVEANIEAIVAMQKHSAQNQDKTEASERLDPIDRLDDTIDRALGAAASNFWSFAGAFSDGVSSVVSDGRVRDKVSGTLSSAAHAAREVADTVQRNAEAVEAALLARANGGATSDEQSSDTSTQSDEEVHEDQSVPGKSDKLSQNAAENRSEHQPTNLKATDVQSASSASENTEERVTKKSNKHLSANATKGYPRENLDVNAELARAAKTIQNSIIGQTVGGLFGNIWTKASSGVYDADGHGEENRPRSANSTAGHHIDGGHVAGSAVTSGGNGLGLELATSRYQQLKQQIQKNPDTYCQPAADLEAFASWSTNFDLDQHESACVELLDTHESINALYERLVPKLIEEDIFWKRYFFALYQLAEQEKRRLELLQRAGENAQDDDEAGWDDDDDDDNAETANDFKDNDYNSPEREETRQLDVSVSNGTSVQGSGGFDGTPPSEGVSQMIQKAALEERDIMSENNRASESDDLSTASQSKQLETESTQTRLDQDVAEVQPIDVKDQSREISKESIDTNANVNDSKPQHGNIVQNDVLKGASPDEPSSEIHAVRDQNTSANITKSGVEDRGTIHQGDAEPSDDDWE